MTNETIIRNKLSFLLDDLNVQFEHYSNRGNHFYFKNKNGLFSIMNGHNSENQSFVLSVIVRSRQLSL